MPHKPFIISLLLLISTALLIGTISLRGQPQVIATNLENLPMEIAGYQAIPDSFPDSVYQELNADLHIYRHYRNANTGHQIDLYIGYYGTAKGGRTGHNPYACLPGAGWGIIREYQVKLRPKGYSRPVSVNGLISQRGRLHEVVLHWYQSAGNKILSTGIQQNIQRFVGMLLHNRNDGAFVRLSAMVKSDDIDRAQQLLRQFALELLPLLPQFWPEEQ